MPDIFLFLIAAMTLTLAPGPDNIYVLMRAVAQGRAAGLTAAAGFCSGLLLHTLLAVVGFAAIIKAWPAAYDALRYAGAAYLIYLGVRTLRAAASLSSAALDGALKLSRIYWQSVIANMLNPKVTLFSSLSCRNSSTSKPVMSTRRCCCWQSFSFCRHC